MGVKRLREWGECRTRKGQCVGRLGVAGGRGASKELQAVHCGSRCLQWACERVGEVGPGVGTGVQEAWHVALGLSPERGGGGRGGT